VKIRSSTGEAVGWMAGRTRVCVLMVFVFRVAAAGTFRPLHLRCRERRDWMQ
jgi:hypothetical protein